ncbi:MAG: arylsulfatase [bacterium]|nr:arylsulfatase [bacterium]
MQTRREMIKTMALSAAALAAPRGGNASESGKKPNIILILADDMGWSDLGCYGSEIATPNLDRLAAGGVRFTRMHNTAKCFPSRACLLTGLYAQQCGMDKEPGKITHAVTLGEVLRAAGYRTLMAGKHHGTENPFDRGFDRYYGLRDGCCNYFNPGLPRPGEGQPAQKRNDRVWCIDGETYSPYTPLEPDFYTTDAFTQKAIQFLEEGQNEDKPFFLYLAYTAPHDPLMAWPEDIAKYRETYKVGYEAIRNARYERQRKMGLIDQFYRLSEPTHAPWNSLSPEKQAEEAEKMAVYAAMIDRMDQNIGRLLAQLDAMGEMENTLILFASDNGCSAEMVTKGYSVPGSGPIGSMTRWTSLGKDWANVSNVPFRFYKNYSHEGGICTPMIAHWPERIRQGGRISERMGHFIDVMPTFLEVAGAAYPSEFQDEPVHPFEGESFVPVLDGQDTPRKTPLFWQWAKGKAVFYDKYKLVSWQNEIELYDMENDKTETWNLAPGLPEIVSGLQSQYQEWWERCGKG